MSRAKVNSHQPMGRGRTWCTACGCECDPYGRRGPCGCCE